MVRRTSKMKRLLSMVLLFAVAAGTVALLVWLNEQMNVRYQAVGLLEDASGQPLHGVEVVLTLSPPPPAGPQLDALFISEGVAHGRHAEGGELKRSIGPTIGLSGPSGVYLVRAIGRTGASRAIRLGLDSDGRPPFETGWLILRREGLPDVTRTVSLLGWRPSPSDWGAYANRLPLVILDE